MHIVAQNLAQQQQKGRLVGLTGLPDCTSGVAIVESKWSCCLLAFSARPKAIHVIRADPKRFLRGTGRGVHGVNGLFDIAVLQCS